MNIISHMVCHKVLVLFIQNALCCGLQLLSACYASTERGGDVKASQRYPLFAQISG